jgi:hypothetical protein
LLFFLTANAYGVHVSDELLYALQGAETGYVVKPRPGDMGAAIGVLQIRRAVVYDVNNIYGTTYKHTDANDLHKSYAICRLYLSHYGRRYRLKMRVSPTDEVLARIWNGGPDGWQKASTRVYWLRVSRYLTR